MNVIEYYEQSLKERGFKPDRAQRVAAERLQTFYDEWSVYLSFRTSAVKRLLHRPHIPRGVYLWGGFGRGKSFLMDTFYNTVPLKRKTRVHFHEFMRSVHRELNDVKGTENPLDEVAKRISRRYRLICFDEFHVSDVADAMILYKLLTGLFKNGTEFVMTSNYEPCSLYPDGLHRDRLLPAIALIENKMDILNVDSGIDYRRLALDKVKVFHYPNDDIAEAALKTAFETLSDTQPLDLILNIEHREIKALARSGTVVWFDFATLCGGPRSQNDYLELANRFQTIILSGVPCMGPRQESEARRFTWLIDVLYDHNVKLVMSAECEPDALYTVGPLANEFQRTVSRIEEMQTKTYLDRERRHTVLL